MDNSFSLAIDDQFVGSGEASIEWMSMDGYKSDKIVIFGENAFEVDCIGIYDVSKEYKE